MLELLDLLVFIIKRSSATLFFTIFEHYIGGLE